MENKIKVGEYVRTNEGIIDKVDRYSIGSCVYHCKNGMCIDECETVRIPISDIKKHSFNIIDLIEERDYVNGIKIYSLKKGIGYGDKEQEVVIINKNFCNCKFIRTEDIKSIVTKEQFEIVEYEV